MRITDLLKPQSIDLNAVVADKPAAVERLVDLMEAGGNLADKALYKARVLAREAESCTLLVDGRTVPMASWLLSFEDQAPFEPFPAYAASKARFHDHWRLLDEGKELKVNTKLTVVGQLPRGYVVQVDGETGYMALADVSLQRVSVSSGSGSSGGDWTDPTL